MARKYTPNVPQTPTETHDEFLVRLCANISRGIGSPAPTQEEIETAQNWLIHKLQGCVAKNFEGARFLVGYDEVDLIYLELLPNETTNGVYLHYK